VFADASEAEGVLPAPRQEVVELVDLGAPGDDTLNHIGQIFLRIDTIELR
jgi:hypothetical protein